MSKDKLKIVPQYIKNVTKSSMYTASDIVKSIMPSTENFVSSNSDLLKSVSTDIRNLRTIVKQTNTQWNNSETGKTIQNIKKNFFEDLKTGKWYNKQRDDKAALDATGFGDLFDFDDFGFDDSFDDAGFSDDDMPALSTADKVQAQASLVTANAVNLNTQSTLASLEATGKIVSKSMMDSADYIVANQTSINSMNMVNHYKMFNEVNAVLGDMAMNLRGLFQYTSNITTYFNASAKMYEDMNNKLSEMTALSKEYTEMQRNLYKEYNASNESKYKDDNNSFISNGLDIKEYLINIKKRAKKEYQNSTIGSTMTMFGEDTNLLKTLEGSPAKYVLGAIGNKLISQQLKNSAANFDKTMSSFFENLLFKFSSSLKEKGQFDPFAETAYKIFGLDLGEKKYVRTDTFVKGPLPYNGYADKSITDVIPTYLRKILSVISGQKEMIYDYSSGKFLNETQIKENYDRDNRSTYNGMFNMKYAINERVTKKYQFNDKDQKAFSDNLDKFMEFIVDTGHFVNPNKDDISSLMEKGLYLDSSSANIILGALKSMKPQELMGYNKDTLDAIRSRDYMSADMNKNLHKKGYSSLFDGSNSTITTKGPMSLNYTDAYNKSVFDYMRDIRQILLEGIKVYSINLSGSRAKRELSSDTNYDDRMKRYALEKKKMDNISESFVEDDENAKRIAKANNRKYIDSLDLMAGDPEYFANQFKDIPNVTNSDNKNISFMGSIINKMGIKIPSQLMKPAQIAKDLLSAPERVMINLFDMINDNLLLLIYGMKDDSGQTFLDKIGSNINKMTDNVGNYFNEKIANPIKGLLLGEKGIITNLKNAMTPMIDKLKDTGSDFLGRLSNNLFGSGLNNVSPREFYNNHIRSRMSKAGIGAVSGLALSFMTPLGLIGGPLLGASIGFASTSERIKSKLFGELDENGERTGNIIPKNIVDQLKSSLKPMGIGAGIGAMTGLLTPLGIVGSTLFGGAAGFISNMDNVKNYLFGKMGKDGREGGLIPRAWQDKFGEYKSSMLKGAGLGVLGSFFLPGGPVGGAIVGLAGGIAAQSDKIKSYLFGNVDPEDGKRYGGLFGKLKEWLMVEVLEPLKLFAEETTVKMGHFFKKNIVNPFLDALDPLKKQFGLMKDSMVEQIKGGWQTTKEFIGGVFEKQVGVPFGQLMREKFIDPLKNLFGNLFNKLGTGLGKILSAPFKAFNSVAMDYMDEHVLSGNDEYYGKWAKKKDARDKRTDDDYKAKMDKIKQKKDKYIKRRDGLEKDNFSDESIKKVSKERQAERQIWIQQNIDTTAGKIYQATVETTNVLKDIYKEIKKSVTGAVNDTTYGITQSIKLRSRKKAHDKKHIVNTPSVFYMGDGENSHASGLDNVPEDNYNANLHKGEMVIPADQANEIRRLLGAPETQETKYKGKVNDKNKFVNNLTNFFGKKSILTAIYDKVSGIFDIVNKKRVEEDSDTSKGLLKTINKNTKGILNQIDGQLVNLSYNVEYIARILEDQFGKPSIMPNGVKMGAHKIKGFLGKMFGKVKSFFAKPIEFISGLFKPITDTIKGLFNAANEALRTLVEIPKTIFNGITKMAQGVLSVMHEVAKAGGEIIKNIAKSIPAIIGAAATMVKETAITIGKFTKEIAVGAGKAIGTLISTTTKLTGQFIELSARVIPKLITGAMGLVAKIGGAVKSVFSSITSTIFGKKKKDKIFSKIAEIKLVELVNKVNMVDRVNVVGSLEKINDVRLYNKMDKMIEMMKRITSGGSSESSSQYANFTNNEASEDGNNSSPLTSLFAHENNDNDFGKRRNKQFQSFQNKEANEGIFKKLTEFTKLQKNAFKANINTSNLLTNAFSKSGIFGILSTAFGFLMPIIKNLKSKILSLGGKLYDKFFTKFISNFPSIKTLFGKNGTIGRVGTTLWGYLQKIISAIKTQSFTQSVSKFGSNRVGGKLVLNGGKNILGSGTSQGTKYLLGEAAETAAETTAKNVATKYATKSTTKYLTGEVIEGVASASSAKLITNVAFNVADDIPKNGKLFTKIMNSSAMKKLCGSKIGKILPKVGQYLSKNLAKAGSKFFGKLATKWTALLGSGAASGMVIPAIWIGASIVNGISATNRIFKVSPNFKPSILMRTIAGVANFLENNVTFGLISSYTMATFMASYLLSDKDLQGIQEAQDQLNTEYEEYAAKNGSDAMSFDDYNGKVVNKSLGRKIWDGTKSAVKGLGNFITGDSFKDDTVRKALGLDDDANLGYAEREATFLGTWANRLTFGLWEKDDASQTMYEGIKKTKEYAIEVWSKTKETFGNIKDGLKEGIINLDAGIGAVFGLEDKDGNKINYSTWWKNKAKDSWSWFKETTLNTKKNIKSVWKKTKNLFGKMKDGIGDAIETFDAGIGAVFGLEDKDGNKINFTTWYKGKFNDTWKWIGETASDAMDSIKKSWSKLKDTFGKVKDGMMEAPKAIDAGLGAVFGLEDEEGNPIGYFEWYKGKVANGWEVIKEKSSEAMKSIKKTWSKLKDSFGTMKDKVVDGATALDDNIGSALGLQDEKGNPISLSSWYADKATDVWGGIKDKAKEVADLAGDVWDELKGIFSERLDDLKNTGNKADSFLGKLLGFEDEDGNNETFTEGIKSWYEEEVVPRKSSTKKKNAGNGLGYDITKTINAGSGDENSYVPEKVNGAAYWSQNDARWSSKNYGSASIGASGCGPTSAAMLLSSVTDKIVTPEEAAQYSLQNGHRIPGQGTAWSFFPAIGKSYGIDLNQQTNLETFKKNLQSGKPAILSGTGAQPFTKSGHLIMATGMSKDGSKIIINDPVSKDRSIAYDTNFVLNNTRAMWQTSKSLKDKSFLSSLNSITSSSDTSSSSTTSDSSESNSFLSSMSKLGELTSGLLSSVIKGEVFDPSKLESQSQETGASVTTGSSVSDYNGTASSYDMNWSSLTPIGKSGNGNDVYGSKAIRGLGLNQQGFIDLIAPQAIENQKQFGIPASTTIAQAGIESGWGQSVIGNNMFGIKEGSGYSGPVVSAKTTEDGAGGTYSTTANFRGYKNISQAIYDHAKNVIVGNPQWYSDVITNDWEKSVEGLSEYATGRNYIPSLKNTIKSNNLTKYNSVGNGFGEGSECNNISKYINAGSGFGEQPVQEETTKPIDSTNLILGQITQTNEALNNAITARDMVREGNTSNKIDHLIVLLQKISNNTDTLVQTTQVIAENTNQTANELTNANTNNTKKTSSNTNTKPKVNPNQSALAKATSTKSDSAIMNAYSNAKKIALGLLS